MQNLYQKFCTETLVENGVLSGIELHVPENFNFAYDVIDEIARVEPERRALVWCNPEGERRTFTFGEIARESMRTANLLRDYGVSKGDRVMLILKRHYEFWFAILALHRIGAVAIPATSLLMEKDLTYRFNAAGVSAILCTADGEVARHVDEAHAKYPALKAKFIVRGEREGWASFAGELAKRPDSFARPQGEADVKSSDPMLLYFTSGTTGMPKMVMHSFGYPIAHIVTARHWHNVDPDGLHLTVSETGWAKSVWGKLYGQWIMEGGIFVYDFEKFDAADLLSKIQEYRITTFCAPPTIFRFFIKEGMEGYDLSSLQHVTIAGEALNPEVFHRFKEYTGLSLMEAYGQTETTVLVANLRGMTPKPGSMGKPSPLYKVEILDENDRPVPPGEVGEICVDVRGGRPGGLFMGYHRDEALTSRVLHDGFYHTGDTAWRDEDGYFWYVGRTDDIIKSSGYRIGPFEIESVLMEHPAVLECAVTGVPDPVRGQVVKATIVLMRGRQPGEELKKEIQDYVKHATAPYKYPRIIE